LGLSEFCEWSISAVGSSLSFRVFALASRGLRAAAGRTYLGTQIWSSILASDLLFGLRESSSGFHQSLTYGPFAQAAVKPKRIIELLLCLNSNNECSFVRSDAVNLTFAANQECARLRDRLRWDEEAGVGFHPGRTNRCRREDESSSSSLGRNET
jgi:hypothetical protein